MTLLLAKYAHLTLPLIILFHFLAMLGAWEVK